MATTISRVRVPQLTVHVGCWTLAEQTAEVPSEQAERLHSHEGVSAPSPRLSPSPSLLLCEFLVLHLTCFLLQSMAFVRTCGSWRSQACLAGMSMRSVSQSSVVCTFPCTRAQQRAAAMTVGGADACCSPGHAPLSS